jgi:hypothetical protein
MATAGRMYCISSAVFLTPEGMFPKASSHRAPTPRVELPLQCVSRGSLHHPRWIKAHQAMEMMMEEGEGR